MDPDVPTFRLSVCVNCSEAIAEVRDADSGVLDWYSDGGDFGCADSPNTNEEGTGSHFPAADL